MTMLAETVDAVIGIDTHRDSHEVEIADAAGRRIAVMRIGNDSAGFTRLLAAIGEVVPGPRVTVCMEGSRSYGVGLARALAVAGDRALNRAIHAIALVRMRSCPRTQAYVARRTAKGKTRR